MCDTIIATPPSTAERIVLFGKNSDRQRNEAQALELKPRADYAAGEMLKCTHMELPQAAHTHAVLLSRPFWIWGAEMGANEHGVVIGNEGLQVRGPAPESKALIGMDLLRLALERSSSAAEAVEVITTLLERYGQGGNCGHIAPSYYHNGFMIADARDAFVLETVNREWMLERVRDVRAISNEYSIGAELTRCSSELSRLAQALSASLGADVPLAEILNDPKRAHIGSGRIRRERATSLLSARAGQLRTTDFMRILRDHDPEAQDGQRWDPRNVRKFSLCLHAAAAENRIAQTTASMVSEIRAGRAVHWVTGTAAPCISIFKPLLFDASLPDLGPLPTDQYDPRSLWWRHERLHRAALRGDFASFMSRVAPERDALGERFSARVDEVLNGGNEEDRTRVVADCWAEAAEVERRWLDDLGPVSCDENEPYVAAWERMNGLAGVVLP